MEKTDLTIREAKEEDTGLILALIRALAEYEKMADQVVATEALLHRWLFRQRVAECLIAEVENEPVGFALYFHNFSTFLGKAGIYLEDLFIYPQFRGRCYGTALLRRLAEITLQRGGGRLEWSCLDWNTPSIGFYRSLGAVAMDDWTVYRLTGDSLDALARSGGENR